MIAAGRSEYSIHTELYHTIKEIIMKRSLSGFVAVFSFMLFLSAGSAFAAEPLGVYVGLTGGYVIPQTLTISDPDDSANYLDLTLKNGYLLGIKTGWNTPFTRRIMAMEVEYNYFNNNLDNSTSVYGETYDGNMSVHAILFNLKARYPQGKFHPYIGGGLGYAYMSVGDITERGSNPQLIKGDSGSAFCWQFLAGVDFDITPNIGIGIGYKYFATKPTIGNRNSSDIYADFDYKTSVLTAGVIFTF